MHFYFLSIFVSLKKPLCGGRCSAEPYSATTVNYIMRRFNELDYGLKYEQIGYLKEIIEEIDQEELTSMKLSDILNVKPQSITKALHRFYADKKMIGRPRKLTEEQELQIIQKINEAFNNHDSLTPKEILEFGTLTPNGHTHTVCVPYYKAAPYNISHT